MGPRDVKSPCCHSQPARWQSFKVGSTCPRSPSLSFKPRASDSASLRSGKRAQPGSAPWWYDTAGPAHNIVVSGKELLADCGARFAACRDSNMDFMNFIEFSG